MTPGMIRNAELFTPPQLHVTEGRRVADTLAWLIKATGTETHADPIKECLLRLEMFRLSRQLKVLDDLLI